MAQKQQVQELLYLSLAIGFLSIVSLVFFFTKPSTEIIEKFSALQHTGTFEYSAPAPSSVYDAGYAQTGEPIFRRVSKYMEVSFDYFLEGKRDESDETINGGYRLLLEVSDESGWRKQIELEPTTEFSNGEFSVKKKIWFYSIQDVIDEFRSATGVERSTYYLTIIPEVRVIASEVPLRVSTFSPEIGFAFTSNEVLLRNQAAEVVNQSEEFVLVNEDQKEASIRLVGIDIPVVIGRYISGGLLILAAGAAVGIRWYDHKMTKAGGRTSLGYEYGDLIVDVNSIPEFNDLIEVDSLDSLIRMAEFNRTNVLLYEMDGIENFYVHSAGKSYRFRSKRLPVDGDEELIYWEG